MPERTAENLNGQSNPGNPPSQAGFKPEFTQNVPHSQPTSGATGPSADSNISWGSFLSGAAVGSMAGYLLNRRK